MTEEVTIGVPTYNRPEYLRQALDSLLAQSHTEFRLVISDNGSDDPRVDEVIDTYVARDSRVSVVRRPENVGLERNFRELMEGCATPYFMWAGDDDLWEPTFIGDMLKLLREQPAAQMAFCTIDNINVKGNVIRRYEGFSRFTSRTSRADDARRFVMESEILGKANLIHGLFRTAALQSVCQDNWSKAGCAEWGGDNVLLFAFVSRQPIVTCDDVLVHKRILTDDDGLIRTRHPMAHFVPAREFASYLQRHVAVSPSPEIARMVKGQLWRRRLARAAARPLSRFLPLRAG